MLAAAEASCGAGALGRAQAERDAAASYHDDARHAGVARRAAGRIHHARRQPTEATRDLLAAAALLGAVDVRLARDTLIEAAVEAQINGQFAPDGATRADVARAAQALPLTPGMTGTAGDLLLDADTQLQLRGPDAAPAGPAPRDRRGPAAQPGFPAAAPLARPGLRRRHHPR